MENLAVALSNLPVLLPLKTAVARGDFWTTMAIAFVGLASFVSHLVENHKHGMPGLGRVSPEMSYYLNRADVLGCILVVVRLGGLYIARHGWRIWEMRRMDLVSLGLAFVLLRISEYDKYNPDLKWIYIVTHCAWHVAIFVWMDLFIHVYL